MIYRISTQVRQRDFFRKQDYSKSNIGVDLSQEIPHLFGNQLATN